MPIENKDVFEQELKLWSTTTYEGLFAIKQ
jgi:hypothetical protein